MVMMGTYCLLGVNRHMSPICNLSQIHPTFHTFDISRQYKPVHAGYLFCFRNSDESEITGSLTCTHDGLRAMHTVVRQTDRPTKSTQDKPFLALGRGRTRSRQSHIPMCSQSPRLRPFDHATPQTRSLVFISK